jgi:TetR/AcrR family transcriptional regulator, cholesterol catabolism regulator
MDKEQNIHSLPQNDRRSQIIEAAASLFHARGYERTTLQDIANEVGITKATLYHYFSNKHSILFYIVDQSISDAISRMTHIAELSNSVEEKIDLAFQQHFQFYLKHQKYHPGASVLLQEKTDLLPPELEEKIRRKFREYINLWEKILMQGVELGVVRNDLDVKMMRWAALGMCNWIYKWASPEGRFQFDQIAQIFSKIFTEGILKKE